MGPLDLSFNFLFFSASLVAFISSVCSPWVVNINLSFNLRSVPPSFSVALFSDPAHSNGPCEYPRRATWFVLVFLFLVKCVPCLCFACGFFLCHPLFTSQMPSADSCQQKQVLFPVTKWSNWGIWKEALKLPNLLESLALVALLFALLYSLKQLVRNTP